MSDGREATLNAPEYIAREDWPATTAGLAAELKLGTPAYVAAEIPDNPLPAPADLRQLPGEYVVARSRRQPVAAAKSTDAHARLDRCAIVAGIATLRNALERSVCSRLSRVCLERVDWPVIHTDWYQCSVGLGNPFHGCPIVPAIFGRPGIGQAFCHD
jgi:hypothetical protein